MKLSNFLNKSFLLVNLSMVYSSKMAVVYGSKAASLTECLNFASNFDNTCSGDLTAPIDLATHSGEVISCTGIIPCPGSDRRTSYTSANPCTWVRKLCVTCSEQDEHIRIRV